MNDVSGDFKLETLGATSTTTKFACLKRGNIIQGTKPAIPLVDTGAAFKRAAREKVGH